jgi:hypothetical protein
VQGTDVNTGKETIVKRYTIDPAAITALVDDASSNKGQIVNLSLKYYQDMPVIRKAIEEKGLALYVVAAGNDDGALSADNTVYPAMYGGKIHDNLSNIITVGALDGDLGIASISNFGGQWVDIGAPGCAVPVLYYDYAQKSWSIQILHGTSMATPIVSFAAALLKSESGSWPPAVIKARLLASADLSPALTGKIADGRILNIPKALSLWHDVVETTTADAILRGKVQLKQNGKLKGEDDRIDFTCRGLPVSVPSRNILKIAPNFVNSEKKMVLKMYYRPKDGTAELESVECDMSAGLVFNMTDLEGSQAGDFALDQVKDYVRRSF